MGKEYPEDRREHKDAGEIRHDRLSLTLRDSTPRLPREKARGAQRLDADAARSCSGFQRTPSAAVRAAWAAPAASDTRGSA
ncbi:hypothetical protein GCM10009587_32330 [Microbacterium maritypicum]